MTAMQIDRLSLEAWQRDQPLSILQLDPADRAVLRIAGQGYSLQLFAYIHRPYTGIVWRDKFTERVIPNMVRPPPPRFKTEN